MGKSFLTLLFAVAVCTPCFARLGETEDQCVIRYGPVEHQGDDADLVPGASLLTFTRNGFSIAVVMMGGKSVGAIYSKIDQSDFTDNEVSLLLQADALGMAWTKVNVIAVDQRWLRDDGAYATHDPFKKTLVIYSKELIATLAKAQSDAEKKSVNGF